MRRFSKKLAFALAAAMVLVTAAPAAQAKAADDFTLNRTTATLYANEGVNDAGKVGKDLTGNVQKYDFNLKNKPADWATAYTYAWSTSNEKVATVTKGGVTTAVGMGKATISCVITDKATGNVVTTLKATVNVKTNAAAVEITNAKDFDGEVVEVGATVDLNRTLVDAAGNKNATRGKVATDLTKWVAEPATGVEINQANGKFTFTEDAVAGDYSLYCYTYQSDKYSKATATSEKVTVTLVKGEAFEAEQKTMNSFDIVFDSAVKELGNVEVIQVIKTASGSYEFPQVVNTVKVADNKMSASVSLFSNFLDGYEYIVKVGEESDSFVASVGAPAAIVLSAKADVNEFPIVDAGNPAKIYYRLYDGKGIDVTDNYNAGQILFSEETYAEDASYYVSGDTIWFEKAGLSATVIAEFQSNKFDDNGEPVGNVKGQLLFQSKAADVAYLQGVTKATLVVGGQEAGLDVPFGTSGASIKLQVKASNNNNAIDVTKNGDDVGVGYITFEETNPNQFAINKTFGEAPELYLFKEGKSTVVVYLNTLDNGNVKSTPIYAFQVNVTPARALATVAVDSASVTVGTQDGLDTATIKVSAKDQYGVNYPISSVALEATNANSKKTANGDTFVGVSVAGNAISIDGSELATKVFADSAANVANLTYKVKVNNSKEVAFTIVLKRPIAASKSFSLEISDGAFGDVGRYVTANDGNDNTEKAKSVVVSAFEMSNGIKNAPQNIAKAPANPTAADVTTATGLYYVKVTKDGKDITNDVAVSGNAVTINFSTVEDKEIDVNGVTGSAVKYNLGAGNYVVSLFKCEMAGEKAVLRQVRSFAGAATCTTKSYTLVKRTAEVVDMTGASCLDEALRNCFEINGVDGKKTENANYVVSTKGDIDSGYVYVESITFFDDLGDGTYAGYTVNIGVSVKYN